ncbi:hypothetical protein ABZ442_01420 [Streptomyces triculaminicus]|uniref:hypothetical protein n=1 Tax=Streptomyces triculaminicus TaxID=2816232 RepID=UPI0033FC3A7D
MTTPSCTPLDDTMAKRTVPTRLKVQALLVPVMTVLGVVSAWTAQVVEGHRLDQSRPCKVVRASVPPTEYVAAWAGLALGIAAVVVCVLAAKSIRRQCAMSLWSTRSGLLAYISVWFNILAIPFAVLTLLMAHTPGGTWGGGDCG